MNDLRQAVLGAWELAELRRFRDGAFYRHPMGEGATGRLIYDDSGLMCAFLMSSEWVAGTAQQGWSTFLSYSGRWDVEGATVLHRLDACSISDLIGRTLERRNEQSVRTRQARAVPHPVPARRGATLPPRRPPHSVAIPQSRNIPGRAQAPEPGPTPP